MGSNGHNGNGHNGHLAGRLAWTNDPAWHIRQRYLRDTLTTSVSLDHRDLKLALYCNDVVDFHRPIFVRKIKIKNLADHDRAGARHPPPGLQHVRDEDRRHRLLRPGPEEPSSTTAPSGT